MSARAGNGGMKWWIEDLNRLQAGEGSGARRSIKGLATVAAFTSGAKARIRRTAGAFLPVLAEPKARADIREAKREQEPGERADSPSAIEGDASRSWKGARLRNKKRLQGEAVETRRR